MLFTQLINFLRYALLTWKENARKFNEGQGLVEYALILVLVAVVVVAVMALLGPAIGNVFSNIVCGVFYAQSDTCGF
ncbi:MAG: hypothetical protein MUF87_12175 [Anaerolineae bacterium]|jgi:pilus assembly protein Flp/PilA|nr:hypothetical protein [Anaerolineae bacterium]